MKEKKPKVARRIIIDIFDSSDEFGDVKENIDCALDQIEGLYNYEVWEKDFKS